MVKRITPQIGIIAEDDSDVSSIRVLIRRITHNDHVSSDKFVGKGCGKINRKCNKWAKQLMQKGCSVLIVVHDLDNKDCNDLHKKIKGALNPCPIEKHMICIPIQEFEAWLLSDPKAIRDGLNLRKIPNVKGLPEQRNSPKEYLGEVVRIASAGERIYLNTKHNEKIADCLSLEILKKRCPSFRPFYYFIQTHFAN